MNISKEEREAIHDEFLKSQCQIEETFRVLIKYANKASILMCGDESHSVELISMISNHLDEGGKDSNPLMHYMETEWLDDQSNKMAEQFLNKAGV